MLTESTLTIVHVTAPAAFGGLERIVHALATGQASVGHHVHVVAVLEASGANHPFLTPLTASGVTVTALEIPGRRYLHERAVLRELLRDVRPSVVHTHGYRPDLVDAGVARRLGIPCVTTVHGFTGGGWRNRLYERLQRVAFRRFDAVFAVSRPLARQLGAAGVRPDRLHMVPNAWAGGTRVLSRAAAREALGVPAEGFRVGWVGRLTQEKGADVLLEALALMRDLPVAMSVVGSGAEEPALQRLADDRGVADRVTWTGAVPDAGSLLSAFDVFVLSSRTEGTPIVLFEAMAAGVPVIATAVGGVPDVLAEDAGLLVPSDEPRSLASALRAVYEQPDAARQRVDRAREQLESRFALAPWLERYEAVYRQLVGAS